MVAADWAAKGIKPLLGTGAVRKGQMMDEKHLIYLRAGNSKVREIVDNL